jgi:hypothetical protein
VGGPFRAIVGGSARYRWTFGPAAWIRVDNNSTQYFKLDELDDYVVPGQVNKFIYVDGIVSITGLFAAPPGASQAAPTAGQIAQVWTYDVGAPGGPLGPSPGLLLPIGLDSPLHLHHHSNTHLHGHSTTHVHNIGSHSHNHSTTHTHIHSHPAGGLGMSGNSGPASAGTAHTHDSGTYSTTGSVSVNSEPGVAPGATDSTNLGNAGASAPGNTDAASPGDSDLENVQHTHP